MPKFKLKNREDIATMMKKLAVETPFVKETANFDQAVHYNKEKGKGNLWLEFINQKLVMEVNYFIWMVQHSILNMYCTVPTYCMICIFR